MASAEQVAAAKTDMERDALLQFNCAQRAHYNFMESYPQNLALILIGGLQYPRVTAATAAFWIVNRALYAIGYTNVSKSKNGAGRYLGVFHNLGGFALLGIGGKVAWDTIMS
jgi:glutathione S-transferase